MSKKSDDKEMWQYLIAALIVATLSFLPAFWDKANSEPWYVMIGAWIYVVLISIPSVMIIGILGRGLLEGLGILKEKKNIIKSDSKSFDNSNIISSPSGHNTYNNSLPGKEIKTLVNSNTYEISTNDILHIDNIVLNKNQILVSKGDWEEINKKKDLIGKLGEKIVLEDENRNLLKFGFNDLIARNMAELMGDGLGYDIISYDRNRNQILIEVKASNSGSTAMHMTANELSVMQMNIDKYQIKFVHLKGPDNISITTYSARDILSTFTFHPSTYILKKR